MEKQNTLDGEDAFIDFENDIDEMVERRKKEIESTN